MHKYDLISENLYGCVHSQAWENNGRKYHKMVPVTILLFFLITYLHLFSLLLPHLFEQLAFTLCEINWYVIKARRQGWEEECKAYRQEGCRAERKYSKPSPYPSRHSGSSVRSCMLYPPMGVVAMKGKESQVSNPNAIPAGHPSCLTAELTPFQIEF